MPTKLPIKLPAKPLQFIRQHLPKLFLLLFIALYFILLSKPIALTSTDVGRHLVNGKEILTGNFKVLYQNFYSSTMPEQRFINHHWLSGVIFYLVFAGFGFGGLHIFHTLILLTAGILFYLLLKDHSSWKTAGLLSIPALIFLAARTEIRPESFGLLFMLIELHWVKKILAHNHKGPALKKLPKYSWVLIPLLHLVWVNLHISFVFSLFIIGLLTFVSHFKTKTEIKKQSKILLSVLLLITLINPNHIFGALAPLSIFGDYGYKVFENQTLWFLRSYYAGPVISLYFVIAFLTTLALWFAPPKVKIFEKVLATIGLILGFLALRNIPIFLIFSFPLLAKVSHHYTKPWFKKIEFEHPNLSYGLLTITLYVLLFFFLIFTPFWGKLDSPLISLGLKKGQTETINAIRKLPSKKSFFNNYDIGSAMIFALSPDAKVFVDNRPEAYSSEFFHNIYVPMQENDKDWQEQLNLHDFQYIMFGHRDITPWAKTFFKKRLRDPNWAVIYLDEVLIIFARKNAANQELIEQNTIQIPLSRLGI